MNKSAIPSRCIAAAAGVFFAWSLVNSLYCWSQPLKFSHTQPSFDLPRLQHHSHLFSSAELSMDGVTEQLLSGTVNFHNQVYQKNKQLFDTLAHGQHPKSLFITCSDSRIDPSLITQSHPGSIFYLRNIGNIIPQYGSSECSEGAVIEYAVKVLGVKDIIVCGHSQCGAMKALTSSTVTEKLPLVKHWLDADASLVKLLKQKYKQLHGKELENAAAEENVLLQLEHLKTYPCVADALEHGTLKLHAWLYTIESCSVYSYAPGSEQFLPIEYRQQLAHVKHTTY